MNIDTNKYHPSPLSSVNFLRSLAQDRKLNATDRKYAADAADCIDALRFALTAKEAAWDDAVQAVNAEMIKHGEALGTIVELRSQLSEARKALEKAEALRDKAEMLMTDAVAASEVAARNAALEEAAVTIDEAVARFRANEATHLAAGTPDCIELAVDWAKRASLLEHRATAIRAPMTSPAPDQNARELALLNFKSAHPTSYVKDGDLYHYTNEQILAAFNAQKDHHHD